MSEPTPERLREIAKMMNDDTGNWWGDDPDDLRTWADDLEGRTQPTRDEVARAIANQWANGTGVKFMYRAALVVDALVAAGWLGVSDTRAGIADTETPRADG